MRINKAMSARTLSRYLACSCLCLIVLASIDCSRGDRLQVDKSTITLLYYGGDERILSPYWDDSPKFLVFLPLVMENEKGELEGRLAESWEHSPDYRAWTIHLRKDVRWHDGVPVTAHDIKFTMDLYRHPELLMEVPDAYIVTLLDDFSLRIVFKKPVSNLSWWDVYYPKHLLEDLDPKKLYDWKFWTQPVGNGPYRYVRHVPGTMMEFEINPDYFLERPRVERVVIKFGGSTPLTELLSGNVDIILHANRTNIPKLANDPRFRVYYHHGHGWRLAIYWNLETSFFRNPLVRRALTLAINRGELLQLLNMPNDLKLSDGIYSFRQHRRGDLPEPLPYDPEMAVQLLEEAGWRDQDGDGIRKKGGQDFHFEAIIPSSSKFMEVAVYVQANLRKVGVRMEVQSLAQGVVVNRAMSGDFQAMFFKFNNAYLQLLRERQRPYSYKNPRFFQLWDAVNETGDPDEKDRIYRELMALFNKNLPITFLFPQVVTFVAHRRIRGLSSPLWNGIILRMEHLWIEDEGK